MKLLRKYVFGEMLQPFMLSLVLFTFIFIVGNLVKLADLLLNKGVAFTDIMVVVFLLMPKLFGIVLPTSLLMAILLTVGSLAQNNEIIAIRAGGISVGRVFLPIVLFAFLMSVVALILNDQVLPRAAHAYRTTIKEILIKRPLAYLEAGRLIKDFQDYIIFAQKIENNQMQGITIYQPQEGRPTRTIVAERGEIIADPLAKSLTLKLYNGSSDEPNEEDPKVLYKMDFKTFELPPIQLGGDIRNGTKKIKDMTLDELLLHMRELKRGTSPPNHKQLTLFKTELHHKIAFSFSTFFFALVGIPLALITRRGEVIISFLMAMGVITIYYVLLVWASTLSKQGTMSPLLVMWIPNLVVLLCAAGLFSKIRRD